MISVISTVNIVHAAPQRIVSIDFCADVLAVYLADPNQIVALSPDARNPLSSPVAHRAKAWPSVAISAESVMLWKPDLVLAGIYTPAPTRHALERMGLKVITIAPPQTLHEASQQMKDVGKILGHEGRGAAWASRLNQAGAVQAGEKMSALLVMARGFVSGHKTLADDLMQRAGFANLASHYGIKTWGQVTLEQLAGAPPDVLLLGKPTGNSTLAEHWLDHPVLKQFNRPRFQIEVSKAYCGGPPLLNLMGDLKRARANLEAKVSRKRI